MKITNLKIRKATKTDLESLNKFSEQESLFAYNSLPQYFLCKPNLRWAEKEFGEILESNESFICVAELDKKILGLFYMTKKTEDEYLRSDEEYADVHTFWIDGSAADQKNETAKSLLLEAEKWARSQKIKEIRSLEFVQANANKEYYERAKFDTRNVGLFKDLNV